VPRLRRERGLQPLALAAGAGTSTCLTPSFLSWSTSNTTSLRSRSYFSFLNSATSSAPKESRRVVVGEGTCNGVREGEGKSMRV
jgi:hypothetical protein